LFLKALRPFTMNLFSPPGIDLSQKAVLLGAVFLIDFVHFENSGNNRN